MRSIPQSAIDIVKRFEGCRLEKYKDVVGYATIGWGHLIILQEQIPDVISQEMADQLLVQDLTKAMQGVLCLTTFGLTDNELSALISFTFNLGIGCYQRSQLRMRLNRGNYKDCPAQFLRYDHAGGQIIRGLYVRRRAEADLFLKA